MFIWNNSSEERLIKRQAEGLKSLRIEPDVAVCDNVDIGVDDETHELVVYADESCTSEILLVKEFGLYQNIPATIEYFLCGEHILIKLISGGVVVCNPETGERMLVSEETLFCGGSEIVWLTAKDLLDTAKIWQDILPQDFMYTAFLEVKTERGNLTRTYRLLDKKDISFGAVLRKQTEQACKKAMTLVSAPSNSEYDDNDFEVTGDNLNEVSSDDIEEFEEYDNY